MKEEYSRLFFKGMEFATMRGTAMPVERVDETFVLLYKYLSSSIAEKGEILIPDAGYGPLMPLVHDGFKPIFLERNLRAYRLLVRNIERNLPEESVATVRLGDCSTEITNEETFRLAAFVYHPHDGSDYIREVIRLCSMHLAPGGTFFIAGKNRGGIATYEKVTGEFFSDVRRVVSRKGVRIISCKGPLRRNRNENNSTEKTYWSFDICGHRVRMRKISGVFSGSGLDKGTALLLDSLNHVLPSGKSKLLDVGCGSGVIGIAASLLRSDSTVDFVDVDTRAIMVTNENLSLNCITGASVFLSDGIEDIPTSERHYDLIMTHPQVHTGNSMEKTFISDPAGLLKPGGRLLMVAAGGARYMSVLKRNFDFVEVLDRHAQYSLFLAWNLIR